MKLYLFLPVIHVRDIEQVLRNVNIAKNNGSDGVFLINPYGMMKKNQKNISIFEKRLTESKHQQDFYYENLMLLYFKGELARRYGFVEYKCIDLTYKNNIREGCLLIKSSIEEN